MVLLLYIIIDLFNYILKMQCTHILKKIVIIYEGAWVKSKMSGRNPPLYTVQSHQSPCRGTKHNNYKRHDKLRYSPIYCIGPRIGWVSMKEV